MHCPECRQENPPESRFCNACGAALASVCPSCAHSNPAGSRFCNVCGHALSSAAASVTGFRTEPPHPPAHLVEKALTSRSSLEGERKQVTVLFADLKGSLELLADRDPEEARGLLDPVLERMMEAVHRYEGTVNQVMGDGIMALFGAPLAHEDHALRACYAALRMQQSVGRYGDEVQRAHGIPLQIRIGLNSGAVVVRSIGNDLRMDYTAVGQTTHLAARMEQMAKPGSILVAADAMKLVEGYVDVVPLGPVPVKGLAQPVEVFELVGAEVGRSRLQAAATRGLSRFIGRDQEIEVLRHAAERAQAGHGQLVATVGEPGVGKSRLIWEFTRSHRTHGWLVLQASCVSFGKATPYLPAIDLLKGYFGIRERDDVRTIREKVVGRILALDEALRPALSAFFALFELSGDDPEWQRLAPPERRRRTIDAIKRLLVRESQVQPLLLIFEDLHWLDGETQALLDVLTESLGSMRLLMLVNYRPEYQHSWGSKTSYSQVRLDPLEEETAEALLRSLVGDAPDLQSLRSLLIDRTEGNPFFIEETVRNLVEIRVLAGERGAYRLEKALPAAQVPPTVHALLAARIDRLAAEDKRVLQIGAIIGEDFSFALLRAVSDVPEDGLRHSLAMLQAGEYLYEKEIFPDLEYTFKHAVTHEVAYASMLTEQRRQLHARVVDAVEALNPNRAADLANRLAFHAFRGEAWDKALRYLHQTGGEASRSSIDAVLGGAESPGYLWWTGDYDRALLVASRDLTIAASFGHFSLRIVTGYRLGQLHHALGNYPRAIAMLEEVADALQGELAMEQFGMAGLPSVLCRAWLAWSMAEQGEFPGALERAREGLRIAESADHAFSLAVASFGLGMVHLTRGDIDEAVGVLERGLVTVRVADLSILVPFVESALGAAYVLAGRVEQGRLLLDEAVEKATSMRQVATHALRLAWLGAAHLHSGRYGEAEAHANQALRLAMQHREPGHEAHAHHLLGEIAARRDPADLDEAANAFGRAAAIARELGMRPLLARCHMGLGAVAARQGDANGARAHHADALELLRALEMRHWLARAEEEVAALVRA